MVKHIVTKPVGSNGVIDIVIFISIPVVCQLLGAEHKNGLVAVFVVFNNGKGGKGFTKTDAIRKDAAVVFLLLFSIMPKCFYSSNPVMLAKFFHPVAAL